MPGDIQPRVTKLKRRIDLATGAGLPHDPGEVKAVQLKHAAVVQTLQGERHARPGEWLVTEPDGSVRIVTDEVFRLQTLRQQLLQMILRGQRKAARRA